MLTLKKQISKCNQEIMKPKFNNNDNERKIIVTAPYIKGATERIDKLLRPYLKLYSINQNSLKNKLCQVKDRRLNEDKKNVV